MNIDRHHPSLSQMKAPGEQEALSLDAVTESAWVDVVHQMEEVYSDLIRYQVEIEQKNEALEEAHQFISSVLGTMTDVLIVCDRQGAIQQVNGALEQVIGIPGQSLHGRPFNELFTDESRDLIERLRSGSRNLSFEDREMHLLCNGADVPLSMNCTPRRDTRGRVLGMVLIGRPIGELRKAYDQLNASHLELKRTQQQLVDSEKMASLGRLVAGVAHELNNPISFVYGNVHSLIKYCKRLSQYLEAVHRSAQPETLSALRHNLRIDKLLDDMPSLLDGTMEGAERVRDIVMDLRSFSSGQKEHSTRFDLVHVIQTAVHWVTRDARIKVRIGYNLPERILVQGHPGQTQQVLINLVQNAVDAMSDTPAPRLELSLSQKDKQVWFRIHDNGPGIPEAHISKVFEPFFTTKPVGEGTGLGLSLSYGLVAEQGGNLIACNHPHGGALFIMELPSAAMETDDD